MTGRRQRVRAERVDGQVGPVRAGTAAREHRRRRRAPDRGRVDRTLPTSEADKPAGLACAAVAMRRSASDSSTRSSDGPWPVAAWTEELPPARVIIFDRIQDKGQNFQIDCSTIPQYRRNNCGTTLVTRAPIKFSRGTGMKFRMCFNIKAIVGEDNEPSQNITRLIIDGKIILDKMKLKFRNLSKKFTGS